MNKWEALIALVPLIFAQVAQLYQGRKAIRKTAVAQRWAHLLALAPTAFSAAEHWATTQKAAGRTITSDDKLARFFVEMGMLGSPPDLLETEALKQWANARSRGAKVAADLYRSVLKKVGG